MKSLRLVFPALLALLPLARPIHAALQAPDGSPAPDAADEMSEIFEARIDVARLPKKMSFCDVEPAKLPPGYRAGPGPYCDTLWGGLVQRELAAIAYLREIVERKLPLWRQQLAAIGGPDGERKKAELARQVDRAEWAVRVLLNPEMSMQNFDSPPDMKEPYLSEPVQSAAKSAMEELAGKLSALREEAAGPGRPSRPKPANPDVQL